MEHVTLSELTAEPHASVFERDPKTVRLALDAGESVAEHDHPGKHIVLLVLEGTVDVALDGDAVTLEAGEIVRFDGERRVKPTAVTDAEALVVLATQD